MWRALAPAGRWLAAETDHSGRGRIEKDPSVPKHPEVFVIGDTASLDQDGKPLPGVAQVAIQQGRYAGRRYAGASPANPIPGRSGISTRATWQLWAKAMPFCRAATSMSAASSRGSPGPRYISSFWRKATFASAYFLPWVWTYLTGPRESVLIVNHRGGDN
jgi:hypothetical protein